MASELELAQILSQDNFTLDINAIAPTARDILLQKNLMMSKNLQRSPMYQSLYNAALNKFNQQIKVDDTSLNLNTLEEDWTNNVGGYNQLLEKDNSIYQNKFRNASLNQISLKNTVTPQTNASEINQYVDVRSGASGIGSIEATQQMTSNNVGGGEQEKYRDLTLSQNKYLNTDKSEFVVEYSTNRKKGIDYIKQLQDLGFDINTNIEKSKLNFSWKDSLSSLGGDVLGTVGSKLKGIPIQTGYDLIKRGLAGSNETQLAQDGLTMLGNQLGYNIAQNASNGVNSAISQGLDNLLNGTDPFNIARYEITTGGNGTLSTILNGAADLIGISPKYHIPLEASLINKQDFVDGKPTEATKNKGVNPDMVSRNNLLLTYSGKGQAKQTIGQLQSNKYKPYYEFDKNLKIKNGKLYKGYTINNGFTDWGGLSSSKVRLESSEENVNQTKTRFSWEEGRPNQIGHYFDDELVNTDSFSSDSLLGKTSEIVKDENFGTLINRKGKISNKSEIQSAVNVLGEISRGNNVVKKSYIPGGTSKQDKPNGIQEFCRVWTFYDQYDRPNKFIRNKGLIGRKLVGEDGKELDRTSIASTYSVLNGNGYPQIAPYSNQSDLLNKKDWKAYKGSELPIKKYMFSLENLAWSDKSSLDKLHPSEIGNGDPENENIRGRIMWFPPYNLKYGEAISNNLTKTEFIGRGEPIITYNNTSNTASLSFTLLVDHPSIINEKRTRFESEDNRLHEPDGEINRFFSGCDVDIPEKIKSKQEKINEVLNKTEVINGEKTSQTVSFFFPNDVGDSYLPWLESPYEFELEEKTYPAKISIDVDERWSLTQPFSTSSSEFMSGTEVEIKNTFTKDGVFSIKPESDYRQTTPKKDNITSYKYFLDIVPTDKFEVTSNNVTTDVDGLFSFQKVFYLAPGENRSVHRISKYWEYEKEYGRNQTAKAILSQDENNAAYKEFKNQIEMAKSTKELTIAIKAYSSFDGSKAGWGTAKPKINGFLAARRASVIMSEVLPKIFTNDLDISKIPKINVNVELYSETEGNNGKNLINDKESTGGRRVDVVITSDASKSVNITGNQNQNIDKEIAVIEQSYIQDYQTNLPNNVNNFEKIGINDKIIWETITEKIKNFNPVFHSQTPEDLNSRLTFLKQCMRQGPTSSGGGNAYNLAFGKQPVCILRIGDFVHTKIMIESMSIQYEPLIWDLNPEGVGVQPMIAEISLNIIQIGGQDISGPISQLQNAVSFNHVANSSIFDPRATTRQIKKEK